MCDQEPTEIKINMMIYSVHASDQFFSCMMLCPIFLQIGHVTLICLAYSNLTMFKSFETKTFSIFNTYKGNKSFFSPCHKNPKNTTIFFNTSHPEDSQQKKKQHLFLLVKPPFFLGTPNTCFVKKTRGMTWDDLIDSTWKVGATPMLSIENIMGPKKNLHRPTGATLGVAIASAICFSQLCLEQCHRILVLVNRGFGCTG